MQGKEEALTHFSKTLLFLPPKATKDSARKFDKKLFSNGDESYA
jgi:hypothetical protein